MHQAGRGSQSKLPCQHRASQPLWVGRELEGLVGGLSECPGATLLSLYSVTNGKSNQGGLPKEVGMKEEQIYTYSTQDTKVLPSIHQCQPHDGCQGTDTGFSGPCALLNERSTGSLHCPSWYCPCPPGTDQNHRGSFGSNCTGAQALLAPSSFTGESSLTALAHPSVQGLYGQQPHNWGKLRCKGDSHLVSMCYTLAAAHLNPTQQKL